MNDMKPEGLTQMTIKGHVDGMAGSYVTGWAVAVPDTGNCAISITDGNGTVLAKGRASRHRADLASVGAGRSTLAFRVLVKNLHEAAVLHVSANGVELEGSPLEVGPGRFDGDCAIEGATLVGWVAERIQDAQVPFISVYNQHGHLMAQGAASTALLDTDPMYSKDLLFRPARFSIELRDACFGCGELLLSVQANDVQFAEQSCNLTLMGNIETLTLDSVTGWLASPDAPQRAFEIEVYRDGELFDSTRCDIEREDVRAVLPDCDTPGFSLALTKRSAGALETPSFSLRLAGSSHELFDGPYVVGSRAGAVTAALQAARLIQQPNPGMGAGARAVLQLALDAFIANMRAGQGFTARKQLALAAQKHSRPRLTIIIPVYRGVEITVACIASVLAHRNYETDQLVLINDASPDSDMQPMLNGFADVPNLLVIVNEQNLGFVKSVNRGLSLAQGGSVVLLNADTEVFAGGFDELCNVATSSPDIGTVTAMSNNATIFSYPHPHLAAARLEDIEWKELAAIALSKNRGMVLDVPTGHGFCMLIKGQVLRRVGFLSEAFGRGYGEENDFCQRAAALGYRNVAAGAVLVEHRESISFTGEKAGLLATNLPILNRMYPEYTPVIMDFERQDGLRTARWALDAARLERARSKGTGFVLLVVNSLDGGTNRAIEDYEKIGAYGDCALLELRGREDGFVELRCAKPEIRALFAPHEVIPVFVLLAAADLQRIFVHQTLGFSAGLISRLGDFASRTHSFFFTHDFYPLCPRVTMIDAIGRFCNVADTDTCGRCVDLAGSHEYSKLDDLNPAQHRALFYRFIQRFTHVVAPSESASGFMRRAFPALDITTLPHPEPGVGMAAGSREGSYDEIVMIGAIGPHKGSGLLLELARRARLTHPHLKFRVIGYTDIDRQLLAVGNVTITGRFEPPELPALVARSTGRLALFMSPWPETYSYALSEAAWYGFIPLVMDIGAPAARVSAADYGVVLPYPPSPAQILDVIDGLKAGTIAPHGEGATPGNLFPTAADEQMAKQILGIAATKAKKQPATVSLHV